MFISSISLHLLPPPPATQMVSSSSTSYKRSRNSLEKFKLCCPLFAFAFLICCSSGWLFCGWRWLKWNKNMPHKWTLIARICPEKSSGKTHVKTTVSVSSRVEKCSKILSVHRDAVDDDEVEESVEWKRETFVFCIWSWAGKRFEYEQTRQVSTFFFVYYLKLRNHRAKKKKFF